MCAHGSSQYITQSTNNAKSAYAQFHQDKLYTWVYFWCYSPRLKAAQCTQGGGSYLSNRSHSQSLWDKRP